MFHIIDSNTDLESLDKELLQCSHLGVDTEFRRTGKEKIELALIQVNNSEETFIIDCVLIGGYSNNCKFLFSEDVIKIFHSSREDIEAIYSWTESKLENVFDTQLANAFLGGSFSISYQDLVYEKLEVLVDKVETRSNWLKRPLRESQLEYAASDVQFLIDLYLHQSKDLDESNKFVWFKNELDFNSKKIFLNEEKEVLIRSNQNLSRLEEKNILDNFNKIVLATSEKLEINPTVIFSKRNQRDFLRKTLNDGFKAALQIIPNWRRTLFYEELHQLFKDYSD